ncbi:Two-component response regulator protein [Rhodopirellula maiorica SM1]|uniref:Two-component response regulator protein n=1 Tax=Rhodopirellula maiorica SM1 TaxID=1265738 RepID=M5R9Y4_9BACT|nr:response regulator [Rhodopirellula maiorica]EMI16288.1 Two-component response regulator protein [Rhodopirellula maiorica SM1]
MQSLHVLVIEDDVDFANTLEMTLRASHHHVTVTHNWLSVMAKLRTDDFDLIVADVETPTGNGLTALEFLNQDDAVAKIEKVFVTGRDDAETMRRCREMNAAYLHKTPRVFAELDEFVRSICNTPARVHA